MLQTKVFQLCKSLNGFKQTLNKGMRNLIIVACYLLNRINVFTQNIYNMLIFGTSLDVIHSTNRFLASFIV